MGLLATLSLGQVISFYPDLRLLLLTGFLGSYTTFSSYELDIAVFIIMRSSNSNERTSFGYQFQTPQQRRFRLLHLRLDTFALPKS